jgi:hypothetical protein
MYLWVCISLNLLLSLHYCAGSAAFRSAAMPPE